jgi:hypothetical protein
VDEQRFGRRRREASILIPSLNAGPENWTDAVVRMIRGAESSEPAPSVIESAPLTRPNALLWNDWNRPGKAFHNPLSRRITD